MIKFVKGNLLEAQVDALVNTVNCVGAMGKGIALQFKQAFPENFRQYYNACKRKEIKIGRVYITENVLSEFPKYIVNFPTKDHWRDPSNIEFVNKGLDDLKEQIHKLGIKSIAIPPLGSGLGGLSWELVKESIVRCLSDLDSVEIFVYEPGQVPRINEMIIRTPKPEMTLSRAILIILLDRYQKCQYRLSLLEIQKLMYFMQELGQDLKLKYIKHKYGPYAHNLENMLQGLDGHYIKGYGDRTQKSEIEVNKEYLPEALNAIKENLFINKYIKNVFSLIEGFETPYGLELLSTVHWLYVHEGVKQLNEMIKAIQAWNTRKGTLFQPNHIEIALEHLKENHVFAA